MKIILMIVGGFIAAFIGFIFVTGYFDNRCIMESFCFGPITSQMLLYHEKYAAFPPNMEVFVRQAERPLEQFVNIEYPSYYFVKKEILPVLYNPEPDLSHVDKLSNLIIAAPLVNYGERKCIFFLDPAKNEFYIIKKTIPDSIFKKYWRIGDDAILRRAPLETAR